MKPALLALTLPLLAILLSGCGDEPSPTETVQTPAPLLAKGGRSTSRPAIFTIANTANLMHDGNVSYQDDGCLSAQVTDLSGDTSAGLNLFKIVKGKVTFCDRAVTLVLDRPHHPGHVSEDLISPVRQFSVTTLALRLQAADPTDPTVGGTKVNGVGLCVDAAGNGRGLRLEPTVIPGSTRLTVTEVVPGSSWHVTSVGPEQNIAGCIEAAGDTTYWHVDVDFMIDVPPGA